MAKWLVPHLRCLTLPVAVNRKRFLVDLCVFCLVMAKQTLLLVALGVLSRLAIRINWGQKCSRNWAGIQGEKRGFLGIGSGAFQTAICPSGSALEFSLFSRLGRIVTGVETPADFVPKNQEKPRPKAVLGRLWIKNTA
ncbi:MAG: hypothetical protein RLZZ396_1370 [Planctomycetota bacterium]